MGKKDRTYTYKIRQKRLSKATYARSYIFVDNRHFFVAIGVLTGIAFWITDYPAYARWFGFVITSFGLIKNDSIQTLGIFITSNAHRTTWWTMWSFIAAFFFVTVWFSWIYYDGDVSYQRLQSEGFKEDLGEVTFVQLLGPIVLLLLTRFGIPVSTTFLLLSIFVTEWTVVGDMVLKSVSGYGLAFVAAFCCWGAWLAFQKQKKTSEPNKGWYILQWISSGLLWAGWLMQDGANMAIFFERRLDVWTFTVFCLFTCFLLGILFYTRGGSMRRIVEEKTGVTDVRAATSVNLFYMLFLYGFIIFSRTPMSTTWTFIGLLGGRELASAIWLKRRKKTPRQAFFKSLYLIRRDLFYAMVGLVVSVFLSFLVNPVIRKGILEMF